MEDALTTDFWHILLWSFWLFIWIAAFAIWFRCLFDLFSDRSLSGWAKAGWVVLLVLLPWLGALIYLIARGRSMTERQRSAFAEQRAAQEEYIKDVASNAASPASQIADAKTLFDTGVITEAEFESLKARAMA